MNTPALGTSSPVVLILLSLSPLLDGQILQGQSCLDVKVTNNQGHQNASDNHRQDVHKELDHGQHLLSENSPQRSFMLFP